MGLQPVIRHQWYKVASRPRAKHQTKYEWVYVYGFVNPANGETHWLLLPTVNSNLTQLALDSFAKHHSADDKILLLIWDRAGFHENSIVKMPNGVEVLPLPPYSPELQPAERLWPSLREAIANRWIKSVDELENVLSERIRKLMKTPEKIGGIDRF